MDIVELATASSQSNVPRTSDGNETASSAQSKKRKHAQMDKVPDFSEKTWKEDLALLVENKRLYVAKNILALLSPVFDRMFQSAFKEKDKTVVVLPGKTFEDVQEFLQCIYPGVMKNVSEKNVYRVLPLAEEYQVDFLKSKCEEWLLTSMWNLSIDQCYDLLGQAAMYNMEKLMKKCIEIVSRKPIENLDKALKRMVIPLKTVCEIKDQMVRRLEEVKEKNGWYEGAYKILLPGVKHDEKCAIEKCRGWTSRKIHFWINVAEMQPFSCLQHAVITRIFDNDTKFFCTLQRRSCNLILLIIAPEKHKIRGFVISLIGRILIKCGTSQNADFTELFEMTFKENCLVQKKCFGNNVGCLVNVFDEAQGFIHNDKMEVLIHLLAERREVPSS